MFKIFKIIPEQKIGGLEISQNSLIFSYLLDKKRKKFFRSNVACDQCVLNGKIQDEKKIKEKLKELNSLIKKTLKFKSKEPIKVAVTLPGNNFFSQSFSLPLMEKEALKEAIILNLKLSSPQEFEKLCTDWQIQKIDFSSNKITFLGVFFPKSIVKKLEAILKEADFFPVAIEPFSLSLSRAITHLLPFKLSDLVLLYLTEEGIEISIFIERKIHFFFFQEWYQVSFKEKKKLIEFLKRTIFRTQTFWKSHFKLPFPEMLFLAGKVTSKNLEEITKEIKKEFPHAFPLSFLEPSQGAALRKLLGIYQQKEINLLSSDSLKLVEKEFKKTFFSFWQKTITFSLIILIGILLSVKVFLGILLNYFEKKSALFQEKNLFYSQLSVKLQKEAEEFNKIVDYLILVQNQTFLPIEFFEEIERVCQENEIKALEIIPLKEKNFRFKGQAPSLKKIIYFVEGLKKKEGFSQVNLSFKDIHHIGENKFIFQLTFSYEKDKK